MDSQFIYLWFMRFVNIRLVLGFDRFVDNQFVDSRSAGQCHYRFSYQSTSRTHGPRVASVPGITRTAVIMSPSNELLNTLPSISLFSIAAKVDNARAMFTGNRQVVVEK